MGVFSALGKPEYASCRPLFGLPAVVGSPKHCYSVSPCALDHEHGPDVAHGALTFRSNVSAFENFKRTHVSHSHLWSILANVTSTNVQAFLQ